MTKIIFEEFPQIKKKLWSGHLWSAGYYVASLLKFKKKEVEGDNQLFLIKFPNERR